MLKYNDIRKKDEIADKSAKIELNMKDSNISFSREYITKERIHDRECTVYHGFLRNVEHCPLCGQENKHHSIIMNGYKETLIQLIPHEDVPAYLHLFKQRFECKKCRCTFTAKTYYVYEHCTLSRPLLYSIAFALKKKVSIKDVAERYYVSTNTVSRVLDIFYPETK